MLRNVYIKLFSIIIVIILSVSVFSLPVVATAETIEVYNSKISDQLLEVMENATPDEKIKVWVWFSDIDLDDVTAKTEQVCGFTKDSIAEESPVVTKEVEKILTARLDDTFVESDNDVLSRYLSDTETERNQIREKKISYNRTFRSLASEKYEAYNTSLVKSLRIPRDSIEFQSSLTPSIVVNLTRNQIYKMLDNSFVVNVDYYDCCVEENTRVANEEQQSTDREERLYYEMLSNNTVKVVNKFGLTGDGVNILHVDHDYVRADRGSYDLINNTDNILNVVNGSTYDTSNTSVLPNGVENHGNYLVAALLEYAPDVNVYSVKFKQYSDIEHAVRSLNIDIVSYGANHGPLTSYGSSPVTQWVDSISARYEIPVICLSGNTYTNLPVVSVPGYGYNTITAGSYYTDGSTQSEVMYEGFRYNPIDSYFTKYKPDMIVASGSTSMSVPALSGIAALIVELDHNFSDAAPMKALLMASCHNKVRSADGDSQEEMENGLTLKQGAGKVDAYNAICTALLGNYWESTILSGAKTLGSFVATRNGGINVSLSWIREVTNQLGVYPPEHSDIGIEQELTLAIYCDNEIIASSNIANSGKQLIYFEAEKGSTYTVEVVKLSQNQIPVKFACAWSEDVPKELIYVDISGKTAIGQSLQANAMSNNESNDYEDADLFEYQWESSYDGLLWSNILGATDQNYILQDNDIGKFIRCSVLPKETSGILPCIMYGDTDLKIVLYGDANGNGTLETQDATRVQKFLANLVNLTEEQMYAADVNGDGVVTMNDANLISKRIALQISKFPVE